MGTNVYVDAVATCNNPAHTETLHIGKSSMGWEFTLRGHEHLGLIDWPTWRGYLEAAVADGRPIRDEYGQDVTLDELERWVFRRGWDRPDPPLCHHDRSNPHLSADSWRWRNPGDAHLPARVETGPHGCDIHFGEFS